MQEDSKSNKDKNKEEISGGENISKGIEKEKSPVLKKGSLTSKKEKAVRNSMERNLF